MIDSNIPCPGATQDNPHNLKIIDDTTGNLLCCHPVTNDFICPFNYRDTHKNDYWRAGYNSATGKYETNE